MDILLIFVCCSILFLVVIFIIKENLLMSKQNETISKEHFSNSVLENILKDSKLDEIPIVKKNKNFNPVLDKAKKMSKDITSNVISKDIDEKLIESLVLEKNIKPNDFLDEFNVSKYNLDSENDIDNVLLEQKKNIVEKMSNQDLTINNLTNELKLIIDSNQPFKNKDV